LFPSRRNALRPALFTSDIVSMRRPSSTSISSVSVLVAVRPTFFQGNRALQPGTSAIDRSREYQATVTTGSDHTQSWTKRLTSPADRPSVDAAFMDQGRVSFVAHRVGPSGPPTSRADVRGADSSDLYNPARADRYNRVNRCGYQCIRFWTRSAVQVLGRPQRSAYAGLGRSVEL
jgi:hypothetical protein